MASVIKPKALSNEDRMYIIDVRDEDAFFLEHIPGSRNIPLSKLATRLEQLKSQPRIILSCEKGMRAQEAANLLLSHGFKEIELLEGSLTGWKKEKLPTIMTKRGINVMQQVQLTVGFIVLLGYLFYPLRGLTLIAGCGLVIAGLTNSCLLASLLQRMPWNKG